MISAKRIVEIFRTRGGGEDFINLAQRLTSEQLKYLRTLAGGEPIIAKLSSEGEWLVLTESQLVIERSQKIFRVPFGKICHVDIPKQDFLSQHLKVDGGRLELGIQDGTSLRIQVQPGGPYFGLMNVLMRIARVNRRKARVVSHEESTQPTSNIQHPTTQ